METYIYKWRNNSKRETLYGRKCQVLGRYRMNSAWVIFENGQEECISRNALRKINGQVDKGQAKVCSKDLHE